VGAAAPGHGGHRRAHGLAAHAHGGPQLDAAPHAVRIDPPGPGMAGRRLCTAAAQPAPGRHLLRAGHQRRRLGAAAPGAHARIGRRAGGRAPGRPAHGRRQRHALPMGSLGRL
jgi:hypothetical protein